MTTKTYVISLQDEVGLMTQRLMFYTSELVSHLNNYIPSLELAVDSVLKFDTWFGIASLIQEYGAPPEAAEDIAVELRNSVVMKIQRSMGQVQDSHDYDFRISALGDLWLFDHGQNERRQQDRAMEEYIDQLRESYYNGDYLPTNERRLIGV